MTDLQHKLDILDQQILQDIMTDMINGTLYREADDITLLMMLEMVAIDKEMYRSQGVIIGEA
jgi:hypothetical protein